MSHYRSNLRDIEFNLFEVHRIQDYLQAPPFDQVDRDTVSDLLAQVEVFACKEWAASFVAADRLPLTLVDGEVRLPTALKESLSALAASGFDQIGLPTALGGIPIPPSVVWAVQELFLGANPTAVFYATGGLFARVLEEEGTESQRRLAKLMVERKWAGTMVLTEADAGSDVGAGATRAVHVAGEAYQLEGVKRFITAGEHDAAQNIIHFVLARPVGGGLGTKGLSLFIVPKFLINADGSLGERNGIVATKLEDKLGIRGSATCELTLGADRPCQGYLVGGVHDGIRQMFKVIQHARMTIGVKSAATLSTGYLTALAYAKERVQGPDLVRANDKTSPRVPIINHPDVRRMLMDQKAYAEGLRALVMYAGAMLDRAQLQPDEPSRRADLLLPLVKGYSSETAFRQLAASLQVLGGAGYTEDFPIAQYLRDSKIDSIYEGTTGIQALDLFFRKIVRDQGETVSKLLVEIGEFAKAGTEDGLAEERELLARMVEDTHGHLAAMVNRLPARLHEVGLHTNSLLESLAEVVIGWLLLRGAEVAADHIPGDGFYEGKVASARWFVRKVAPRLTVRRLAAEDEQGWLMALDSSAF